MSKKFFVVVVVSGLVIVLLSAAASIASPVFVATAKNFRGALYVGLGPTPGHACEAAVVKCSQDSFIPPSCKVVSVRAECPPPCPPPRKMVRKSSVKAYAPVYPMGRPMP